MPKESPKSSCRAPHAAPMRIIFAFIAIGSGSNARAVGTRFVYKFGRGQDWNQYRTAMNNQSMDLSEKIVLVTGGSRGMGRAIAIALADTGAHVAVNYKENKTAARGSRRGDNEIRASRDRYWRGRIDSSGNRIDGRDELKATRRNRNSGQQCRCGARTKNRRHRSRAVRRSDQCEPAFRVPRHVGGFACNAA